MPIYEYQCQACSHELEKLQKLSDEPLSECPQCGKPALKKKVSAAGFRLKGSGWYETDFKGGGKKNIAGDTGGGDSKPAETTATPAAPSTGSATPSTPTAPSTPSSSKTGT